MSDITSPVINAKLYTSEANDGGWEPVRTSGAEYRIDDGGSASATKVKVEAELVVLAEVGVGGKTEVDCKG